LIHPHLSPLPSRARGRKRESQERKRICRGSPFLLFGFLIDTFRNDGHGVIETFRGRPKTALKLPG